ncbi:MAG: hypothetical protein J6A80_06530 [Lachnospiraceae bacterium]|nr:hypothetical protein [Lachnospiraceae bacterium]
MEEKGFQYTYSAKEQNEINDIRKKYLPKEEDKMAQLRRLDASVYRKGTVVSLVIGIIGALIMGVGMSLVMTDIGAKLGMESVMVPGIVIGVVGLIGVCLAYPAYQAVTKHERERIAPEIIRISDELLK